MSTASGTQGAPRRRRWLRVVLGGLSALVVFVVILAVFIQTNLAFQHLLLPLAASHVEGELSVESGSISLAGGVTLKGISLTNMPPVESFKADAFEAKLSLASLLAGGAPRIERLELTNPVIVVDSAMEGRTGEDEDDGKRDDGKGKPVTGKDRSDGPMIPVAVDTLKVVNLEATVKHGGRTQVRVSRFDVGVTGLAPDSTATAKLAANFEIAPDDPDQTRSGLVSFDLKVAQPADGAGISYEGSSIAAVQEGKPRDGHGVAADLQLDMKALKGSVTRGGVIQCTLEALATATGSEAGSVTVALDYDGPNNKIQSDIEISRIGREVLNPILAAYGPAQIESARFDTKISVRNEGGDFRFLSKVTGRGLSIRPEKAQPATPLLDITSEHAGLWNPKTRMLTVEKADINVVREGRQVGVAGLDQSLTLDLSESGGATAKELAPKEARVTVQIDDLEVENVRPWLKVVDSDALDPVRTGGLNGRLTATIHGAGESVDWTWDASLSDLRLRPDEEGETLGPFKIAQKLSGKVKDLKSVALSPGTVTVESGDGVIGTATVSGAHTIETGATDLKLRLESPSLARTMQGAKIAQTGRIEIRDGAAVNDLVIRRAGKNDPVRITGTTRADNLTMIADGKRTLTQSLTSAFELELDAKFAEIEIAKLDLGIAGGSGPVGRIGAQGRWPLKKPEPGAKGGRGGELTAKVSGLSAAPWITLLDLGEGRDLGPVPVDGDLRLTTDPTGQKLTYEGQWETTIRMDGGGATEDVKVTVENSLRKLDEQIESFVAELNAARKNGAPDRVRIEGKGSLGDRPAIQADVKVASLDAAFYADAFGVKSGNDEKKEKGDDRPRARADDAPPESAAGGADGKPRAKEWPADIKVNFAVDRLVYRDVNVAGVKGSLDSDAVNLKARLDSMQVNGGSMAGSADLAHAASGLQMAWDVSGSGIDVGPVVNSLSEKNRDKIEGRLTFKSQGAGVRAEGEKRPDLDGTVVFDLADGQLKNSKLLNTISEATGTDIFNKLVYKGFHGEMTLADGWANINQMVVDGNATRLIAEGRIGLDGELEVDVQPAIGPEVKDRVGSGSKFSQYMGALAGTTSDLLAFPIAITARGNASDPKYGVKPKLPPGAEELGGLVGGAVGGVLGKGKDESKDLIEDIGGAVDSLTKGLLNRKKKD